VVFPTPPFWLATLMIRPIKVFLQSDYLSHSAHKFQEKSEMSRNKDHLQIMTSGRAGGMKNSEPLKAD
jgi:hypothetical protein